MVWAITVETQLPDVLLVGGPDVAARIPLMLSLKAEFNIAAAGSGHSSQMLSEFKRHGFQCFYYPLHRGVAPLSDLRSFLWLMGILRRAKPDIVHTFDTKPSVWGRLAARVAGVPVVIGTLPGLGSLYSSQGFRIRMIRAVYELLLRVMSLMSDMTIFQNYDDFRQMTRRGIVPPQKATVIPGSGVRTNEYDRSRFSPQDQQQLRRELGIPGDACVITMVSRLIRAKGVLVFAETAEMIHSRRPKVQFLLVGALDEESHDRLTTKELERLTNSVRWVGHRNDIATIMSITDIFVFPSAYREGIPRVLLEAASTGLPLIATDAPGCNEVVVDGENGILLNENTPEALTRAILTLVDQLDIREKFGKHSRRRVQKYFDLEVVAKQMRDLYKRLLAAKSPSRPL